MTPPDSDPLLPSIRQHLDRQANQVDAQEILQGVQRRLNRSVRRRQIVHWLGGGAVTATLAASLFLFFLLGGGPEPQLATAAELIELAQQTHAQQNDHRYELVIEWELPIDRFSPLEPRIRKSTIWTRGDQFSLETTNSQGEKLIWGQNRAGQVWVVLGPKRGLLYDQDELAEPFLRHLDLMSLRMLSLLSELPQQFNLVRTDTGKPGEPIRIVANLPAGPNLSASRFRRVELELDPETKTIRQAVLKRLFNGELANTMRFTLLESANLGEKAYELETQLDPDGLVIDGRPRFVGPFGRPDPRARFREEFLRRWQGKFR